jgi:hypothetical protein
VAVAGIIIATISLAAWAVGLMMFL